MDNKDVYNKAGYDNAYNKVNKQASTNDETNNKADKEAGYDNPAADGDEEASTNNNADDKAGYNYVHEDSAGVEANHKANADEAANNSDNGCLLTQQPTRGSDNRGKYSQGPRRVVATQTHSNQHAETVSGAGPIKSGKYSPCRVLANVNDVKIDAKDCGHQWCQG